MSFSFPSDSCTLHLTYTFPNCARAPVIILLVLLLFSSTSQFSIKCRFYWNASVCAKSLSRVRLFAALWIAACQAPLSMGFFRKEYWSELHFLLQGIFLTQGSNMNLFFLLFFTARATLGGPMLVTWMCWALCNPMGSSLQAHLSMEFSRQEYGSGLLPCPLPGDLPNPGTKPRSPALQADSSLSEPPRMPQRKGLIRDLNLELLVPQAWTVHCRAISQLPRGRGNASTTFYLFNKYLLNLHLKGSIYHEVQTEWWDSSHFNTKKLLGNRELVLSSMIFSIRPGRLTVNYSMIYPI